MEAERSPSSPPAWRLLILLMAMTAMGPVSLNIFIPAVPQLATTFGTNAGSVQLTISLFLLSLAAGQLMMGPLSDRFGRRPVVIGGLALAAAASVAAISAESIGVLIAARVVQAIGAATGVVVGRAIIRDLYERDRAAAMLGLITTAMVIGPMVSPLIGGLLDTAFGWESIFVFVALFSVGILVWVVLALPETRKRLPAREPAVGRPGEWRNLLSAPQFYCYVLIAAFGSAAFFIFIGGAPHVAINVMGGTSAEYGAWFATSSFGYMCGNFLVSRLAGRYGSNTLIWWGLVIELVGAVIGIIAILAAPLSFSAFFLPQIAIALGNGLMLPNAIAGAVSVRPQAAGAAAGIVGFVQMALGASCAQGISHILVHYAAALPVAAAVLLTTLLTGAACIVLRRLTPGRPA